MGSSRRGGGVAKEPGMSRIRNIRKQSIGLAIFKDGLYKPSKWLY
jgi:hypothetical protein